MAFSRVTAVVHSASAGATQSVTITSVPAGATLVLATVVRADQTSAINAVTGVSSSNGGALTAGRVQVRWADDQGGNSDRVEGGLWVLNNAAAGTHVITVTFAASNTGNFASAAILEFTGMAASALDSGVANGVGVATAASSITVASASNPAQATEDIVVLTTGRWWYEFNGGYSDGGTPPTGYTKITGDSDNSRMPFQVAYRTITAIAAQTASWTVPANQGDGGVAVMVALKAATGTLKTRIKFKTASGINGVTGLTAKVWLGDSDSNYSVTYTGLAAEAAGDLLYCTAPAGAVNGGSGNAAVYKTGFASEYGPCTFVVV